MTDRRKDLDDAALERLFSAARGSAPPPDAFMARLVGDALGELEAQQGARLSASRRTPARQPLWARLGDWILRGAVPTGLAASAVAGLWLGGWAETAGYFSEASVAASPLAQELSYRFPELAGLLGGY
ncbi:MAG: hypothetical protein KDA50_10940 [Rhodobacteraceae bacterium]|nr:hypothetical protein [Paracoccaceae bacterium]